MTVRNAYTTLDALILADSPAAYWKLDDATAATTFVDSSGNSRPASLTKLAGGGPAPGYPNLGSTARSWTRTWASVASPTWFQSLTSFSVECIFSANADGRLMALDNADNTPTSASRMFDLQVGSGAVTPGVFDSTGYHAISSASVVDGGWHHAAVTFGSGTLSLYIDGVSAATPLTGIGTINSGSGSKFYIACTRASGADGALPISGSISRVAAYANTVLSAAKVKSRYLSVFRP